MKAPIVAIAMLGYGFLLVLIDQNMRAMWADVEAMNARLGAIELALGIEPGE